MKATDLLKQQHREIEELLREIETSEEESDRRSLREEMANALAAHTSVEEEIFYPAALEALGPGARIREALEQHALVDFALYRLLSVSVNDESFPAKVASLKDVLMDHLEEEESELLPQADGEMERDQLEQLGDRLAARFEERLAEGHRAILERSLGIAARLTGPRPAATQKAARGRAPAKKAMRAPAKRTKKAAATTTKRGTKAQPKRGAAAKQAQKRPAAGAGRTQARKATQKAPTRGAAATQTSARGGKKAMARGGNTRAQAPTGARKARAGR